MNETETIQHRTIIKLTEELAAKDKEIGSLSESFDGIRMYYMIPREN